MKEIEVKVLDIDFEKLKSQIVSLGGLFVKDEYQENHIFELPSTLNSNGYIRIRVIKDFLHKESKVFLCIKKIISQNNFRKVNENEVEVNSFNEAFDFLSALNIKFITKENKFRKSYKLNNTLIEFEKWDDNVFPYPYVEIEAEDYDCLSETLNILNIPKDKITSKGLPEIKKEMGL